jgi:hypothetical protein
MTATVPGEAVEEVLSLGSCNCMFLIQTVPERVTGTFVLLHMNI